jgi:hypothetical protein
MSARGLERASMRRTAAQGARVRRSFKRRRFLRFMLRRGCNTTRRSPSLVKLMKQYACLSISVIRCCRRFDPWGSLDRRVNCRRVPQPRWVGARRSAKGGKPEGDRRKGETRGLRVCPAPRSGALAVGGYKRPREREREAYARHLVPPRGQPSRTSALGLPFIGVRRGPRCTIGDVAVC